jgi:CAAX prenyl protease-like protein
MLDTEHSAPRPQSPPLVRDEGPERPWEACVVPFLVFLAAGALEPVPGGGGLAGWLGISPAAYPLIYAVRLVATLAVLARCWRPIVRWLGRPAWWPPLLGLALVVPWVVLAGLQRDAGWSTGLGARAGYDPFAALGTGSPAAWAFLLVRAVGLVVVVPLIEELFLRGFLMRNVIRDEFWTVPFGTLTAASAGACIVYAVATHPAEAFAAAGWFAVVSGIAAATRRPIDAVLAHAGTNLALGAYVLATGNWWLL